MPVSKTKRRNGNKAKKLSDRRALQLLNAKYGMTFKDLIEARKVVRSARNAKHPIDFFNEVKEEFEQSVDVSLGSIVSMGNTNTPEEINSFKRSFGVPLYEDVKAANEIIDAFRSQLDAIEKEHSPTLIAIDPEDKDAMWFTSSPMVHELIEFNERWMEACGEMIFTVKKILDLLDKHKTEIIAHQNESGV